MSEPKYLEDINTKREEAVNRMMEEIEQERDEKDKMQRFGFFSIPYPATIGDKKYSTNDYQNHEVIDHKVITEKRGIYTNPLKVGKANDVYFTKIEGPDEEGLERLKELNKKDHEDLMKKVAEIKEKKSERPNFKPSGPQEFKGFYNPDEPAPIPEGTLTIEPDKKRFIGEGHKIITEKRGIFTVPTKTGKIPNDYFSYPTYEDDMIERLKQMTKDDIEKKINDVKAGKDNKNFQKPFQPASLKKCDPFFNNTQTYGLYTPEEQEMLMTEYKTFKKNGVPKYQKKLPKNALKHLQPFKPSTLVFSGRDGLFNDDLYKLPELEEVKKPNIPIREIREMEKKNARVPFAYNKLMNQTHFSPSITSFTFNLKREFPSVKFY